MPHRILCLSALLTSPLVIGQDSSAPDGPAVSFDEQERNRLFQHSPLPEPAPQNHEVLDDRRAAHLGQFLFFDPRLSANGELSCASCHDPAKGFTDGRPVAVGLGAGTRNTMSLWNVAYNRWFFWDGRADSLWSQALQPLEREDELGSNRLHVARQVAEDPELRQAYESIFGELVDLSDRSRFPADARPIPSHPEHPHHQAWAAMRPEDQRAVNEAFANIGKAIAAYEHRLLSDHSPFDEFVEGLRQNDAQRVASLSPAAQRGLKLFIGAGECRLCHSGPNFTDNEFHDTRVPPREGGQPRDAGRFAGLRTLLDDPFNAAGEYSDDREGDAARHLRFTVNGPENWGRFKTPSLRNVALTAPYMHQGQFETLEKVVEYYSTLEGAVTADHHDETILVPRNFTDQEKRDLVAFLESLTDDDLDPALLTPPSSALLQPLNGDAAGNERIERNGDDPGGSHPGGT